MAFSDAITIFFPLFRFLITASPELTPEANSPLAAAIPKSTSANARPIFIATQFELLPDNTVSGTFETGSESQVDPLRDILFISLNK